MTSSYTRRIGATLTLVLAPGLSCGPNPDPQRKHTLTADGALMVLREGDDAFAELSKLAIDQRIEGATFSGFGFGHATFGYFNQQTKTYDRREIRDVELASLTGSIAWKDGTPALHAHAVAADHTFTAYGGHLLGFQVGHGSLEVQILKRPSLTRQRDEALGADVLVLPR